MKTRTWILMGVAVVCGLVASYLTSRMIAGSGGPQEEPKVQVLVAKVKIPYGTQIKEPDKYFQLREFNSGSEPKRALKSLEEVKDRRVKTTVSPDVFITQDDLMTKNDEAMAGVITVGTRGFTIPVKSDTSVGGFVLPLMRVDVVGNVRTKTGPLAKIILQDVLVLGVDMQSGREEGKGAMQSSTVTLQVKPDEAENLNVALSQGDLRLLLRGSDDHVHVRTKGARLEDLLTEKHGEPGEEGTEEEGGGPTKPKDVSAKVPGIPDATPAAPVAPPPPPEPTTKTHVLTIQNGQNVVNHKYVVDKRTYQPTDVEVLKDSPEVEKPKAAPPPPPPSTPKDEEKPEPKKDKPITESDDPVNGGK